MATDINLLRTFSPLPDRLSGLEGKLRWVSMIAAGILLGIGVFVGIGYGILTFQTQRLTSEKALLLRSIAGESQKEALLVAIQSRIAVVEKVRAQTKPWEEGLDVAVQIASGKTISNASIDEQDRFTLVVRGATLEDALALVRTVRNLVAEGRIRSPVLESLTLSEDGSVYISISFLMVFI